MTAGFNELATSLNNQTSHGNSTYNTNPLYFLDGPGLFYYDDKSQLINNDAFGTCTVVSLDPLTIKYTIKDGVKWSDGVPVTAADLLLTWAAESGLYNTSEAQYDDNGNLLPSKGVAFDSSSPGLALVTSFPTIGDNNQSLTIKYSKFFVDYNINLAIGVPAHVVAEKVLKETDPAKATDDLVTLLKNNLPKSSKDAATMKSLADFWNTGFDMTQMPTDKSLLVSNGPYVLSDWKKDQYMTFTVNPDYNWGPKPAIQTIVWQYAPDPTAAVQSLQNGDLQIINPQATPDVGDLAAEAVRPGHQDDQPGRCHLRARRPGLRQRWSVRPEDLWWRYRWCREGLGRPAGLPAEHPASGHHQPADQAAEPERGAAAVVHPVPGPAGTAQLRRHDQAERFGRLRRRRL